MASNELFLTVLPMISLGNEFGRTSQVLTLFPSKEFATEFFPDEVEGYISTFKNRLKYFTGGHVKDYVIHQEPTDDGRVIVRVVQIVE